MTLADVEFNIRGEIPEAEDVLRCLRNLLMTPAGTVPLDRDFGINQAMLGMPLDVAQSLLAVEIIDKVDRYEPRVSVTEVELKPNVDGQIIAKVVITSG
jgi:phage baseplate assembly protein W